MANCKQCGTEYNAKRSTSLYCGPKCKQEFYRNRMSEPVTLSPESVTVTDTGPVTVTEEIVQGGTCWCCGKDIHEALVCCGDCAWSGKAKQVRAGAGPLRIGEQMPCY